MTEEQERREVEWKGRCVRCGNYGFVSAIHRKLKSNYTFRCTLCESAKQKGLSESIPPWLDGSKKEYELFSNWFAREGWKD